MLNKKNEYFFVDIHIPSMKIVDWGESNTATHTGETDDPDVYRMFLPKGQFNKFVRRLT